jgi:Fur family ferric uptake transcriptional regulator
MTTVRRPSGETLDDPDEIAAALRAHGHTVGSTRRAIVDAVRAKNEGFTADELAAELAPVHRTTVYRTLAILEEIGVVHHIHLSHGPALYERMALAGAMRHLVCEVCGRHLSVPSEVFEPASDELRRAYGFELEGSHFAIVGRCRRCAGAVRG